MFLLIVFVNVDVVKLDTWLAEASMILCIVVPNSKVVTNLEELLTISPEKACWTGDAMVQLLRPSADK